MTPHKLLTIPAAVALTLGLAAGTASANAYTADANCDGLTFNLPRAEDGTVVTTTVDNRVVRVDTVATFGAPVSFRVASPDRTVAHTYTVVVDSVYNEDHTFTETVGACVAPTTTTVPSTSTTSTTVPPVVANDIPPTVPPTVPGRPVATTTTVPPPTFTLPETGASSFTYGLALGALAVVTVGEGLRRNGRRGGGS